MLRLFCAGAIALGSVGMVVGAATPASADPLCQEVSTTGFVGNYNVGPVCVPYPFAAQCTTTTVHGIVVVATDTTCVPAP